MGLCCGDEGYDEWREGEVRCIAGSDRECDACGQVIPTGIAYAKHTLIVWERDEDADLDEETDCYPRVGGKRDVVRRCTNCNAIYHHLCDLAGGGEEIARRLDCGLGYEEEHGKRPPEEVANLAFLTPDGRLR